MRKIDVELLIEFFTLGKEKEIQVFSLIMIELMKKDWLGILGMILARDEHMAFWMMLFSILCITQIDM